MQAGRCAGWRVHHSVGCRVAGSVREQSVSLIVPPQPQPHNHTVVSELSFAMAASHDGTECGNLHVGPVCVLYVSTHLLNPNVELWFSMSWKKEKNNSIFSGALLLNVSVISLDQIVFKVCVYVSSGLSFLFLYN